MFFFVLSVSLKWTQSSFALNSAATAGVSPSGFIHLLSKRIDGSLP